MLGVAFDVGISTGYVLAVIAKDKYPIIVRTGTIDSRRIDFETYVARNVIVDLDMHVPAIFIFEWPLSDNFSALARQTQKSANMWRNIMRRYPPIPDFREVHEIRPADWKVKPVLSVDIYKEQPVPLIPAGNVKNKIYRPTVHEKDAARILYWWSKYKLT